MGAGDKVLVFNEPGELALMAHVSDQMQQGLVGIPFG